MRIGNLNIDGILFMSPMAGVTNRAFRSLARKFGASMCYTEMVSSDAIVHNQQRTLSMIDIGPGEHPVGVQLFGASPESVAYAAEKVSRLGADLIDINLGCPVKKVVNKNGGAALLRDIGLAAEIVEAAVKSAKVPVTIKMRTGWDNLSDVHLEFGKTAEKLGISAITLHPRSRSAGFEGKSDWSKIAALKREVTIPVIGNGDVRTAEDAREMLDSTNCDAIMIGRAAMKNPYLFCQIKSFLDSGKVVSEMSIRERAAIALEHARLMTEQFGERAGALKMRKHLSWYSKGFMGGNELREKLKTVESYHDISALLSDYQLSILGKQL